MFPFNAREHIVDSYIFFTFDNDAITNIIISLFSPKITHVTNKIERNQSPSPLSSSYTRPDTKREEESLHNPRAVTLGETSTQ